MNKIDKKFLNECKQHLEQAKNCLSKAESLIKNNLQKIKHDEIISLRFLKNLFYFFLYTGISFFIAWWVMDFLDGFNNIITSLLFYCYLLILIFMYYMVSANAFLKGVKLFSLNQGKEAKNGR